MLENQTLMKKNANDLLISMGAKPVDIKGNIIVPDDNLQEMKSIDMQIKTM